ncbi:hypothetical protein [Laspinema palackyanum]|uniref:hypothetical protein n=1 Tax=Laspinema palackyanum TaxID=3231601 RepID=UPI00345D889A|nr:hypothetical protein [Laspinema sp. D2c]
MPDSKNCSSGTPQSASFTTSKPHGDGCTLIYRSLPQPREQLQRDFCNPGNSNSRNELGDRPVY